MAEPASPVGRRTAFAVFAAFLRLGLTSFGGPIAHLGYFRAEFVGRRRWLDEGRFADIVALCQFLPGPASSQVGMAIGITQAGIVGAFAAWLGFTAPSAIAMILFGYGVEHIGNVASAPWLQGLKVVAVAVVAQAVLSMARALCPDRARATLAVAGALLTLALPPAIGQIAAILFGGAVGWFWLPRRTRPATEAPLVAIAPALAIACIILFFLLLFGLPLAATLANAQALRLASGFYRAGALVFGGGHVVLPLLQAVVVPPGWVSNDGFLAGYGAAQAVPGPLFTFSAYLGTVMGPPPHGWLGGLIALVAIFLPSFLLVIGLLPFWSRVRRLGGAQALIDGVNAAVVGLLASALYTPVWTSAIRGPGDFALALVAFLLLVAWRAPPWLVVVIGAAAGWGLAAIPALPIF